MSLALLIAAAILTPQDPADPYYKFKVGTTWKLESSDGAAKEGKISKIELKVVKEEAGKVDLESKTTQGVEEPRVQALRWSVAAGVLTWSEFADGAEKDPVPFLKAAAKKGDTWQWSDKGRAAKVTHLGLEEVKVPAGTYKDVVHMRCEMKEDPITMGLDVYFAPGAGPVKVILSFDEKDKTVLELKEFKAGK